MVYRKKRYNRRYKNKTKNFNKFAYAKTDSKNQAKQIVRINKKISNVYKAIRPEITKRHNSGSFAISSAAVSIHPLDSLVNITTDLGGFFRGTYSKFIYFNFKFFLNSGDLDLTKGKTIRIIIFQNRNGLANIPSPEALLRDKTQPMISAFREGINNNYKILLSKVYTVSSDKDYLYKSYNFKKLIGYNKLYGSAQALKYGRGTIFIMFFTTQTEEYTIKYNCSLGYTDSMGPTTTEEV